MISIFRFVVFSLLAVHGVVSAASLSLNQATIMPDGRTLKVEFRGAMPAFHTLPDWRRHPTNVPTLSNGSAIEFIGAVTANSVRKVMYADNTASTGGTLPPATYFVATTVVSGTTGLEYSPSETASILVKTLGTQPVIKPLYFGYLTPGDTINIYLGTSPNRMTLYRKQVSLPDFSQYLLSDNNWADPCHAFPGQDTLVWTAYYFIKNPAQVVTINQSLTISAPAVVFEDSVQNQTAAFSAVSVLNKSLVDANGFTSNTFSLGPTGVALYVSSTYGNDANTFVQAQSMTTPLATLGKAMALLKSNLKDKTGSQILLLRGDTFGGSTQLTIGGLDRNHPFILGSYFYSYAGGTDPLTRPLIVSHQALYTNGGGGSPKNIGNVLIRGLHFQSDIPGTSSGGTNFLNGGDNYTFDDNVFEKFALGIGMQGVNGPITNVTILRTTIMDSYGVNAGHTQAAYLSGVGDLLISQSVFDRNGWQSADFTVSDIFSHNLYIQFDSAPSILVGNLIRQGGASGVQQRLGGISAYNIFSGNALQITSLGSGALYKNVSEKARDITNNPRSMNLNLGGTSTEYAIQPSDGFDVEFNIVVNNATTSSNSVGAIVAQDVMATKQFFFRNNIFYNAGTLFKPQILPMADTSQIAFIFKNNIGYSNSGNTPFTLYQWQTPATSWYYWYANSNALFTSVASTKQVQAPANYTLANWELAANTEMNSIFQMPILVKPNADMGSYYATIGGTSLEADYVNHLRGRGLGAWDTSYEMPRVYDYYQSQYKSTNLPTLGTGKWDYFGSSDYR